MILLHLLGLWLLFDHIFRLSLLASKAINYIIVGILHFIEETDGLLLILLFIYLWLYNRDLHRFWFRRNCQVLVLKWLLLLSLFLLWFSLCQRHCLKLAITRGDYSRGIGSCFKPTLGVRSSSTLNRFKVRFWSSGAHRASIWLILLFLDSRRSWEKLLILSASNS